MKKLYVVLLSFIVGCSIQEYPECNGYLVQVVKIDTVYKYSGYQQKVYWQIKNNYKNDVFIEYTNDSICVGTWNRILIKN